MPDININYEATISVGNQVNEKVADFQELLDKIKSVNADLQTYWEGSDSSKYSNAVAQQAEYMQQLATTISEIGAFLVKVGQAYEEACSNNSSAIN